MNALLRSSRLPRHGKTANGKGQATATPAAVKPLLGVTRLGHLAANQEVHMGVAIILGGRFATTYAYFVYLSWVFPHRHSIVHVCMAGARELVRQEARCQSLGGLGLKSLSTVEAIA